MVKEDWVDIGSKKKGVVQKCGRKSAKGSKRKYQNVFHYLAKDEPHKRS